MVSNTTIPAQGRLTHVDYHMHDQHKVLSDTTIPAQGRLRGVSCHTSLQGDVVSDTTIPAQGRLRSVDCTDMKSLVIVLFVGAAKRFMDSRGDSERLPWCH